MAAMLSAAAPASTLIVLVIAPLLVVEALPLAEAEEAVEAGLVLAAEGIAVRVTPCGYRYGQHDMQSTEITSERDVCTSSGAAVTCEQEPGRRAGKENSLQMHNWPGQPAQPPVSLRGSCTFD